MVMVPSAPGTGIGYSPPARKLAVSPDSATRFGSASERATPFVSSALMMASVSKPFEISLLTMAPNGAVPESTPATSIGEIVTADEVTLGPPTVTPGCENSPPPVLVTGSWLAVVRLPMLARLCWPNTFHCTPRSRPAWRVASTKRTSSMTCCGDSTLTELMTSGPNCLAISTALSTVGPSGASPDSMMRPLTAVTRRLACGKRRRISVCSSEVSYTTSTSNTPISFLPSA